MPIIIYSTILGTIYTIITVKSEISLGGERMRIKEDSTLIVSWLKKVKNCQVTQLNWNANHLSEVLNQDIIEEVISSSKDFFNERYKYNILKNVSSHLQLFHQGSIDVLGLEISSSSVTNLYAIKTTIDEKSLYISDDTNVVEITISNMIKVSMLIYAYYNLSEGSIIFASPKLNQSTHDQLSAAVNVLNEIFKLYGFHFKFLLYVNQNFTNNILNPVSDLVDTTIDKQQKWNMEPLSWKDKKVALRTAQYLRKIAVSNDQIKIGLLVQTEIERLSKNNMISEAMIEHLLDGIYSKKTFDINYPLLKKVIKGPSLFEQRKINGYGRYWGKAYIINGEKYLLCNDWYERNRMKFLSWIELINLQLE
jgi:hypothetical protein